MFDEKLRKFVSSKLNPEHQGKSLNTGISQGEVSQNFFFI